MHSFSYMKDFMILHLSTLRDRMSTAVHIHKKMPRLPYKNTEMLSVWCLSLKKCQIYVFTKCA